MTHEWSNEGAVANRRPPLVSAGRLDCFIACGRRLEAAAQAEESHEIRECRVATGRSLHGASWPIAIKRYWSAERGEPTIPGKHDSRLDRHGITGPAAASTAADKVVDRGSFNASV